MKKIRLFSLVSSLVATIFFLTMASSFIGTSIPTSNSDVLREKVKQEQIKGKILSPDDVRNIYSSLPEEVYSKDIDREFFSAAHKKAVPVIAIFFFFLSYSFICSVRSLLYALGVYFPIGVYFYVGFREWIFIIGSLLFGYILRLLRTRISKPT